MNLRIIRHILIFTFLLIISTVAWGQVDYYHFDQRSAEKLMFSAINRIRLENGLRILKRNSTLERAARIHAMDMVTRNFFDHYNPDGNGPRERLLNIGYYYAVSENLGVLSSYGLTMNEVVQELLESLMNSPEHRANILNPDITDIGIAFAQDKEGMTDFIKLEKSGSSHLGYGTIVVCQEFTKRTIVLHKPSPFPSEFKKGETLVISAETYKDFDTVLIELLDIKKGSKLRTSETLIFERSFSEKMNFVREGDFELRISGNRYLENNNFKSEELVTFKIHVKNE